MKKLATVLLLCVVASVVGGVVFYERPVWVSLQKTHFGLFLARVQSNYVMTPEGRVHYYEAEADVPDGGTPLVLVHGLADRSESWAPMLKRLKKAGFHVYAPDLLGYGRSPKPLDSDYSISTEEQYLADFIQALGLQKTDIGGWSMGGWVVLKLALDKPEMVDRVVVYDSAGIKFDGAEGNAKVFHPETPEDVNQLAALMEPAAKPLPAFVARDALRTLQADGPVVDKGMASMQTGRDILDARLPKITEPLLIVWGGLDKLIPVSAAFKMQAMVPGSQLDVIAGCGHLSPKTCPNQVAKDTVDFLRASPAPGTRVLGPSQ